MIRCNACQNDDLKNRLGDKYLMIGNTVYELDAQPDPGQGEPTSHEGRPIQFQAWFMEIRHTRDGECRKKALRGTEA